ncbi:MAG: inverse autotransporter beta domain-containing protein [Coxiellaceae bacterium]|nr:MAG: inverse autotransporter beta domain-containing protein [Coxiellaceae bacterium]
MAAAGGTLGIANGDLMLPLFGNNDNAFLLDGQAKYGNDTNSAISGGLGFRHVYHDARILGGYLYVDRNRFVNEGDLTTENFWFVSPGIESMGNLMDLRINGYIPVSSQQENVGTSQAITFSGHSEFDTTINNLNSTGPGIDGEIGLVKVPHIPHLRAYVGGYHFEPKDQDNITGASGRVEFPLNHYVALTAVDTYDNNVHNTFQVGIRLTLGGMNDDVSGKDIQRRIVDPINRNLSTQYTGTAQPVIVSQSTGNSRLLMDNIYFFTSNDGTAFNAAQGTNNCTFEHPCSGTSFTQSTVNSIGTITNNANLFFNPGGYSLNGQLSLVEGQSIFGRSFDYTQPAVGTERAMFIGSFLPHDNNTFDSIRLVNDGNQQFGFLLILTFKILRLTMYK